MLFYFLYKIGYFISNVLPLSGAYWLAERLANLQYRFAAKDRESVIKNLSIVLKRPASECTGKSREVFRSFGLYMVDFFRMPKLTKAEIEKRVRFEGLENLDNVLKRGKGAISLSCHIGNWEMGGVVTAMLGYDISAVALTHKHKNINEFFVGQREKKGLKVIAVNSVMKRCVSALFNNGILALIGDRDFTDSGVVIDFFGVPTSLPKGPAALSLKTGAAVVPSFFIREGRSNYKLIFGEPIEVKEKTDVSKEDIVKDATKNFVLIMEKYIRKYPEQWLIFRKFWETPADVFVL
jgi:KDO2-lipid IV(A) lauroyltransferase